MKKSLRGIVHVHSNYSYDGHNSLEEIARDARSRGYAFVGMTEHSDTFDHLRMRDYVRDCARVSTSECLVIHGIEFRCGKDLHLVGVGVGGYTADDDPLRVTDFIHREGGIAVIAHPIRNHYRLPAGLARAVDAIEVWNASYDGRFVPNDRSLALLGELRKSANESLLAFGAQDLHRIVNHGHVEITVCCDDISATSIVAALKKGEFTISNPCFRLHSRQDIEPSTLARIRLVRRMYTLGRAMRDTLHRRALGWLSSHTPA
jgi:hypothetical protein